MEAVRNIHYDCCDLNYLRIPLWFVTNLFYLSKPLEGCNLRNKWILNLINVLLPKPYRFSENKIDFWEI